jgi:D-psicose/D-tagatose/L-ribulose 3-epimerase
MQIGFNLLLWTASVSAQHAELIAQLRGFGYDLVELPIFAPDSFPVDDIRKILSDNGLGVTVTGAMPGDSSLISADEGEARRGTDYVKGAIDVCAAIGAPIFAGPIYHPVGSFTGSAPTDDERQRYIERITPLADHAQSVGVRIAVEPLNRFETHFINTLEDAAALSRKINHPAVGLLSDTFHQHIEEKDPGAALRAARDTVIHVHASENHRGCPGTGQARWNDWARVLNETGYEGSVVVESFGSGLPELAAATRVWRDLTGNPLVLAERALPFVRETLRAAV